MRNPEKISFFVGKNEIIITQGVKTYKKKSEWTEKYRFLFLVGGWHVFIVSALSLSLIDKERLSD